jgi:hypothetical protein
MRGGESAAAVDLQMLRPHSLPFGGGAATASIEGKSYKRIGAPGTIEKMSDGTETARACRLDEGNSADNVSGDGIVMVQNNRHRRAVCRDRTGAT